MLPPFLLMGGSVVDRWVVRALSFSGSGFLSVRLPHVQPPGDGLGDQGSSILGHQLDLMLSDIDCSSQVGSPAGHQVENALLLLDLWEEKRKRFHSGTV